MNLLDRLKLLAQSTVNQAVDDALHGVSKKATPPAAAHKEDVTKLLQQADQRMAKLRDEYAATLAREKRAEASWREATSKLDALNAEVDALLRADQQDDARAKLQQTRAAEKQAAKFETEMNRLSIASVQLKQEMDTLDGQLAQIRQRVQHTQPSAPSAPSTEKTASAQAEPRAENVVAKKDTVEPNKEAEPAEPLEGTRMADVLKKMKEDRAGK